MVEFIASILSRPGDRFGVVEAGTGTGKTIAYCIPAALAARRLEKKVVLVTSTVALQEQLMSGELRQLAELSKHGFRYRLIKGRRRYVCVDRLNQVAHQRGESGLDFGAGTPTDSELNTANRLLQRFNAKDWDGNMDAAPEKNISRSLRGRITTDSFGCNRVKCKYSGECPYYSVRDSLKEVDLIVVNYSLLFAVANNVEDSSFLPHPSQCIYVFDEVQRLSEEVSNAGATSAPLKRIVQSCTHLTDVTSRLASSVSVRRNVDGLLQRLLHLKPKIASEVERVATHLREECIPGHYGVDPDAQWDKTVKRFVNGQIQESTTLQLQGLMAAVNALLENINTLNNLVDPDVDSEKLELADSVRVKVLDAVNNEREILKSYFETLLDWSTSQHKVAARWIKDGGEDEQVLHTTPIDAVNYLRELLWEEAYGVICTSATVCTGKGFDFFAKQTGFPLDETNSLKLDTPFDIKNMVTLQWADMGDQTNPNWDGYKDKASEVIPQLLQDDCSGLVLFTSITDMKKVYGKLPADFREQCLIQSGDQPIDSLIDEHRARIDKGENSYIFGTNTFREGIDLPGDYLRHVVIARIPFPVPSDPVMLTQKETLDSGTNTFMEMDIPLAALRLNQACGRLLRNEQDYGKITMLDRRALEKRYGAQIMAPLPDYTQVDLAAS